MSNLLDNARCHTPPGGTITATLTTTADHAELTITNTGTGIPESERERIFHRLVRLSDARERESGGAGLGLPIARGLARAHHGNLTCLPTDHGAAFQLTLPLTTPNHPRSADNCC